VSKATNVEVVKLKSNDELLALYGWTDILVRFLKPNYMRRGTTGYSGAALRGVPVICSECRRAEGLFLRSGSLLRRHRSNSS